MSKSEMIAVANVNAPGRIIRVNAEKYLAMRKALLRVLPRSKPGLTQEEMGRAVIPQLSQTLWPDGEKAMWWLKTVQLDLEAKNLVRRDRESKPLRWYRTGRV